MAGLKLTELDFERLVHEGSLKLEITGGIPTWEASPSSRHQLMVYLIQTSIKPSSESGSRCECAHLADVEVRFPDGSIKRPDIAIFCVPPPIQDEDLTVRPQAVIEVISPGYEYKDLELNPHFYLSQNIEDLVVVDPRTGLITHYCTAEVANHHAPATIELQCGCQCVVPHLE
jgi:Uma2 family endonuclease